LLVEGAAKSPYWPTIPLDSERVRVQLRPGPLMACLATKYGRLHIDSLNI